VGEREASVSTGTGTGMGAGEDNAKERFELETVEEECDGNLGI
jgi:hypothetical protein